MKPTVELEAESRKLLLIILLAGDRAWRRKQVAVDVGDAVDDPFDVEVVRVVDADADAVAVADEDPPMTVVWPLHTVVTGGQDVTVTTSVAVRVTRPRGPPEVSLLGP